MSLCVVPKIGTELPLEFRQDELPVGLPPLLEAVLRCRVQARVEMLHLGGLRDGPTIGPLKGTHGLVKICLKLGVVVGVSQKFGF